MAKVSSKKEEFITSGNEKSFWIDDVKPLFFSPLKRNDDTDVVIVGAGISGLTTAYLLLKEKKKVIIVDDGAIGSGESGRTTAHITYALDDRFYHIENQLGNKNVILSIQSHKEAIDKIEEIVKKEKIKCDFERVNGYLFLSQTDDIRTLAKEIDLIQRIGFREVKFLDSAPIQTFDTGSCIFFPKQAQFHPMKYLQALAKIIKKKGGKIFTQTHIVKTKSDRIITRDGFQIKAKKIIIATGSPIKGGKIFFKQVPYRTYVVTAKIPKGSIEKALYWDTGDKTKERPYAYHYVRIHNLNSKEDLLIVGGEDHKTGQSPENQEEPFVNLENWVKHKFPFIKTFNYRWSGQVIEPIDAMAFIGESPWHENIYMITGDSGNGITHGTIGAMLITDLIMKRNNKWKDLYDPNRKTPMSIRPFIRERMNIAKQYTAYVRKGDISSPQELARGEGGIMRDGVTKLALYRDEKGKIHSYSAVCTHKGCIVKWNSIEKTFDCPCHGSRFSCKGRVINGPATKDLENKKID